jgi:hypothetical protein
VILPLALAVRVLIKNPAPIVPAPTASDLPRNERRLMNRCRGLAFFSVLFVKASSPLLVEPVAAGFVVFMTAISQHLMV